MVRAALTNTTRRGADGKPAVDAANPRASNALGHILEWTEAQGNHASLTITWDVFLLVGRPADDVVTRNDGGAIGS
ncbi:MAG: alkaline phosphatase PhoX [Chloroflexota bacterium]